MPDALSKEELDRMNAYWRAANFLSLGQIHLLDNPLLREPLKPEHIEPRLLGHWGTTSGLKFISVHLNRVITKYDLDMTYVTGPGHGGPGLIANTYLEGTYSEIYPSVSQDAEGMRRLFKQFSFPGGIPSHAAPETPRGPSTRGGELGYALTHAYGAAFDNPDLIVTCVVGDREDETGPMATAWHSNKFLNPIHDGAVLPILHLNGYKIANLTVLARISHQELESPFADYGYTPYLVEGSEPERAHQAMAATLDTVIREVRTIQREACTADVPTLETLAAVHMLRRFFPDLKVRVINVVDLMKLEPQAEHPHGLSDKDFDSLFTTDKSIVFAYHGSPWLIHRLTSRRTNHPNLHVRGSKEEGTTTTPFDMVVRNDMDRFHLVGDVIDRMPKLGYVAAHVKQAMRDTLIEHREYLTTHGDEPEVRDWHRTDVCAAIQSTGWRAGASAPRSPKRRERRKEGWPCR